MYFRNAYFFLSNFYPCKISTSTLPNVFFPSVENAFQAFKSKNPLDWLDFTHYTPAEAKRAGRKLQLRENWDTKRVAIMSNLVNQKFQDPVLKAQLIGITAPIIEHNTWHDNFWGQCTCSKCSSIEGKNMLGKILSKCREDLING